MSNLGLLYLLPAFIWWALLLWHKNEEVFTLQHEMVNLTAHHFDATQVAVQHEIIDDALGRQRRMILGEGSFFFILLLLGVYYIRANFKREIELGKQQRNFQLSITHELKSPIAAVQLAIETLLKRDLPKEMQNKIHGNALRDTKRLNKLVEDILLSASLDDVWKPNREETDIQYLVENTVETVQRAHPKAQIEYSVESDLPLFDVDSMAIEAVLSNIIENALKYTKDEEPYCYVHAYLAKNETLEIAIKDKGMGIPLLEKKRIFDKFYRVGNEDTRSAKGTGLGLYIVKKVMQAHEGSVKIEDNQPKGSIFILNFGKNA